MRVLLDVLEGVEEDDSLLSLLFVENDWLVLALCVFLQQTSLLQGKGLSPKPGLKRVALGLNLFTWPELREEGA